MRAAAATALLALLPAARGFAAEPRPRDGVPPVFVMLERQLSADEWRVLDGLGFHGAAVPLDDLDRARPGHPLLVLEAAPVPELLLPEDDYERYFEAYLRSRARGLTVRPSCANRPEGALRLAQAVAAAAERLADREVFGVALLDSPSLTGASRPLDFCGCEACRGRWIQRLERDWGGLDAAGAAFETSFDAWQDVQPWTVDEVRARNEPRSLDAVNLQPWLSYRSFLDEEFARQLGEAAEALAAEVGAPCGFLGGAPSNAFGGHDWSRLAGAVGLLMPPEDATSCALLAARPREDRLVIGRVPGAGGLHRITLRRLSELVLERVDALALPAADLVFERGVVPPTPTGYATEVARRLSDLAPVLPRLAASRPARADVGILYSMESLRALWLRESAGAGVWWPALRVDRGRDLLPLAATWHGWQQLLDDCGFRWRYLPEIDLETDSADPLVGLRVLVLPRAIVLSERAAERIEAFVRAGGILLADERPGLLDGHGRGRKRGALDALFGIDAAPGAWWRAPRDDAAAPRQFGLRVAQEEGGRAATPLRSRVVGGGHTLLLDLQLGDYGPARLGLPEDVRSLPVFLGGWLVERGVVPDVEVLDDAGRRAWGVRLDVFEGPADGERSLALIRTEPLPELHFLGEGYAPQEERTFTLRLPRASRIEVLHPAGGTGSSGREATVTLPLDDFALLRVCDP